MRLEFWRVGLHLCVPLAKNLNLVGNSYQMFAGTVKFVAKILVGTVSLCIFGVVQDWYCLIGSLVIWCGHVSCVFIANALYVAFIYMYVSLACLYMVYIYLYISHMCSCIACVLLSVEHILCLSRMTWSHVMHSAMCNIVWFHRDNPTRRRDGVPDIIEQP